MRFDILTIFPDIIYHYANDSILARAQKKNIIKITAHNLRNFATDKHKKTDDEPYGGGAGMIMKVEPIYNCLKSLKVFPPARGGIKGGGRSKSKVVIMDPAGKKFNQKMAAKFAKLDQLILISGRYQGFDERVYEFVDERVSVGDYVLSGGELPALVITEAVARLIPGVLGNEESLAAETHGTGAYQQYTKPENFLGLKVPDVLLSGDHGNIEKWRKKKIK